MVLKQGDPFAAWLLLLLLRFVLLQPLGAF